MCGFLFSDAAAGARARSPDERVAELAKFCAVLHKSALAHPLLDMPGSAGVCRDFDL